MGYIKAKPGVIIEPAATIIARNMGSENSREFCQDSETTSGESIYSSVEEPDSQVP